MEYNHAYIAEYVKLAKEGDSDAFAQLYNYTFNKVYNYCRHYLRDDYLAQDAVQEVYISALKNLSKLNDATLFIAWINQIAFHTCYDMCKANHSDYGDIDSELIEEISDSSPGANPEESYMDSDEAARLRAAIDKLPPTQKQLVTLRYFNGLKIDEIVSMTDISKSTVKRHLQSAVDSLKSMMR